MTYPARRHRGTKRYPEAARFWGPHILFIVIYRTPSNKKHLDWMFTQHVSTSAVSSSGVYIMLQTKNKQMFKSMYIELMFNL
jgi:hypothetical protein